MRQTLEEPPMTVTRRTVMTGLAASLCPTVTHAQARPVQGLRLGFGALWRALGRLFRRKS